MFRPEPPMTHDLIQMHGPFTVEFAETDPELEEIEIRLTNAQGIRLYWWSKTEWTMIISGTKYVLTDAETNQAIQTLVGTQLTGISGYTDFYNSTLIFNHQHIVRNLVIESDWGEGWGAGMDIGNRVYFSGWDTVRQHNEDCLPLPYITNFDNPYDVFLKLDNPALTACIGQQIIEATLEIPSTVGSINTVSKHAVLYRLNLRLADSTWIRLASYWCASSENLTISDYSRHRPGNYALLAQQTQENLVGRKIIGFGGTPDLYDATIFLDGGWRVDQILTPEQNYLGVPQGISWFVSSPAGHFIRRGKDILANRHVS